MADQRYFVVVGLTPHPQFLNDFDLRMKRWELAEIAQSAGILSLQPASSARNVLLLLPAEFSFSLKPHRLFLSSERIMLSFFRNHMLCYNLCSFIGGQVLHVPSSNLMYQAFR